MAEPRDSMLDPKYLGGLIGGKGYAFQNAYVLYRLPEWLTDPSFAGFQPEGWEDVEVFYEDDEGKRREAIQVKDHAVTPAETRDIFKEFQRRSRLGERDGIDYRFRLACVGVSPTLQPVETAVNLLPARSGYIDAEKASTRADLTKKVEALGLDAPAEFVEGIRFETDRGAVSSESDLRDVVTMRLYRGGYGLSVLGAEYAYVQLAVALHRWLQKAKYVTLDDVEAIIRREAERHPEEELAEAAYTHDVFVSYARADGAWVRDELLPRLTDAGLKACADFEGCQASDTQLRQAALSSRRTLLVLTPAYLTDAWPAFERLLGTWERAARPYHLVLARRAECQRPLLVRYLPYVDLTAPGAVAWRSLRTALGVPPEEEAPEEVTPAAWRLVHPYAMPPHFTGRLDERRMLSDWLHPDDDDSDYPLLVMRALGGFGKSALAWHWLLHDVDARRWPRVLWWGFYDDSSFDAFLIEALKYLGLDLGDSNPRQQADLLLRCLHQPGTLLILDGFERALRAYGRMDAAYQGDDDLTAGTESAARLTDCVSPIAEHFLRGVASLPGIRGKVLLTTRLRPHALGAHGGLLAGCREVELTQMQPADAVAFFRARGVRGARAEIEAACAPYGYHPLSLRLLAGLVKRDPRQPGDIAAARRLDVSGDLVQRQHHVLEAAYGNLDAGGQQLLSTIACFRGPVGYDALAALAETETEDGKGERPFAHTDLDDSLRELVDRGLLHHDWKEGDGPGQAGQARYDLHPIVRRYAYDRLGGEARADAHGQLRDYFAAVPEPERVERLEDLAPVIELYHHTVRAGQYDEAYTLFRDRLATPLHYQFGAYELRIELLRALFPDGDPSTSSGQGTLPHLEKESYQAWTLNALANSYSLSGQPRWAVPLFEWQIAIREKQGDKRNLAVGLGNLATQQMIIGALRASKASLQRGIALWREIEDEGWEAISRRALGRLLACHGAWAEAEEELVEALRRLEKEGDVQAQNVIWAYRAECALLRGRYSALGGDPESEIVNRGSAIDSARRALELADETARTRYPYERDYVRVHWLLGAAHRANGDLDDADRHLSEALTRCRGINMVDHEADILLDLARLRCVLGHHEEAQRHADEARIITERCEYVLQGADVHLFLAEMAVEEENSEKALEHARQARALATCDGPPDYTYKVAYEEAGALLAQLGEPAD